MMFHIRKSITAEMIGGANKAPVFSLRVCETPPSDEEPHSPEIYPSIEWSASERLASTKC